MKIDIYYMKVCFYSEPNNVNPMLLIMVFIKI